jgi:hypothetical protein
VAEGMWAAYESQAEQRYQEAIQSPASPQQQVGGGNGVTCTLDGMCQVVVLMYMAVPWQVESCVQHVSLITCTCICGLGRCS